LVISSSSFDSAAITTTAAKQETCYNTIEGIARDAVRSQRPEQQQNGCSHFEHAAPG
jgi:hypothetical protein